MPASLGDFKFVIKRRPFGSSKKKNKKKNIGTEEYVAAIGDISSLSISDLVNKCATLYKSRDCLALSEVQKTSTNHHANFKFLSYEKINEIINRIAAFLLNQNFKPIDSEGIKIGIYMSTSFHMEVLMMACHRAGIIIVPVYDALGVESVKKIFIKTNVNAIIVDTLNHYETISSLIDQIPALQMIIKAPSNIDNSTAIVENDKIINFETIMQHEAKNVVFPKVKSDDIAYILLTSGSTGEPKGVMVSHRNLMSVAEAFKQLYYNVISKQCINGTATNYMFLPFAHILGIVTHLVIFSMGVRTAFPSGLVRDCILSDIKTVKPDVLITVPIVLKRVRDKVLMTVKQKNYLAQMAFKLANIIKNPYINQLIYREARQTFGGNLKLICSGGAYVDPELYEFTKNALGVTFVVGYGLSEGIAMTQMVNSTKCDLGIPFDFLSTRLRDVAEMNYYASNGQGELLIKGDSVFKGYYKDPEATAAAFTEDGYFCTGDIMQVSQDNGKLTYKFLDRVKNILKLSQGEYVAPEQIQAIYSRANICNGGIYLHGDFRKSYLVAIGFIERSHLPVLVQNLAPNYKLKDDFDDIEVLNMLKPRLIEKLESEVKEIPSFKKAKKWHFTTIVPTVDNKMLTPTQKFRRHFIYERFKSEIESMFAQHDQILLDLSKK